MSKYAVSRLCVAIVLVASVVSCAKLGSLENLHVTTEEINSASVLEQPSLVDIRPQESVEWLDQLEPTETPQNHDSSSSFASSVEGDDDDYQDDDDDEVNDNVVEEDEGNVHSGGPCNKTVASSTLKPTLTDQHDGLTVAGRAVSVNLKSPGEASNNNGGGLRGKRRPAKRCRGKRKGSCKRRRGNRKPANRGTSKRVKSTTDSEPRTSPAQ